MRKEDGGRERNEIKKWRRETVYILKSVSSTTNLHT